jgi:D-alanyl-D-alanine carboxypeptidase
MAGAAPLWPAGVETQLPEPGAIPRPKAESPLDQALDSYIERYMPAMNAPGMTLGLATTNELVLREASYGYADVERKIPVDVTHLFQIGSISKSFVALVLLQLRDEGKLDLQRPVLEYLPDLPIVTEFGPVTVHHLLTHTSGLPDNLSLFSANPADRLLQGFKPGEHFHYCNAGFDILGRLAVKLDGRPWRVLVEERIFKPLGMAATRGVITTEDRDRAATGYFPYWSDQVYARQGQLDEAPNLVMDDTAGSIQSTPGDMARYLRMLLDRGQGPNGRIVSEGSFTLMSTPYIKAEDFSPTASYGYGIAVDTLEGHKILRHTGGMVAFASSIHVDLDGGVAAFASINAGQGYRPTAVTEYAVRLLRAQREGKPLPPQPAIADPQQIDNAADYAGTFTAPDGRKLTFAARDKRLFLVDGGEEIPLQHAGGDGFVSALPGRFAQYGIRFGRAQKEGGKNEANPAAPGPVVEVSYGPGWFTNSAYDGPKTFTTPPKFAQFAGRYQWDSPWGGCLRVYVLKGRLVADGAPLTPIGGALFRIGEEPWSPLTAEFRHIFEGSARLLHFEGADYWRVEVE